MQVVEAAGPTQPQHHRSHHCQGGANRISCGEENLLSWQTAGAGNNHCLFVWRSASMTQISLMNSPSKTNLMVRDFREKARRFGEDRATLTCYISSTWNESRHFGPVGPVF